jgi:hypothetical protein
VRRRRSRVPWIEVDITPQPTDAERAAILAALAEEAAEIGHSRPAELRRAEGAGDETTDETDATL